MTLASVASVVAGLGLVIALVGLVARALRRYGGVGSTRDGDLRLEVLGRVAVGPRQGLAVVRIGERVVAVSVGDGGVRPVLDLGDVALTAAVAGSEAGNGTRPTPFADAFGKHLRRALRVSGVALAIAAVAGTSAPAAAVAQTAPVPAITATPDAPADERGAIESLVTALPRVDLQLGGANGGEPLRLSGTVGAVLLVGFLALLPTLLLLMTSFTRILVVLHFLRQALGTQTSPPGHLIAALALLLTGFVMGPTLSEVNGRAIQPWLAGELVESEMLQIAMVPFREFMLAHTPESELELFIDMAGAPAPSSADDIPLTALMSAFATSELKAAFQIGFALFLPFMVIDLVVAAVLMSMGMFMMPPTMFSLPCKMLLFVLVDGWGLVVRGLVASFA